MGVLSSDTASHESDSQHSVVDAVVGQALPLGPKEETCAELLLGQRPFVKVPSSLKGSSDQYEGRFSQRAIELGHYAD